MTRDLIIDIMRDLDETDLEILSMLAANARQPFSAIGEAVGLSGPAVSDRVTRLQEAGIINQFTIDIDRSQLRAGVPILVQLECQAGDHEAVRDRLRDTEGIEHVFVTAEGEVWFYARSEGGAIRNWIDSLLEGFDDIPYSVTLVDELEWTPTVDGMSFALTCAECGNTVDSEGETIRLDGEMYHFCCSSCSARFQDRYQRLEDGA